MTKKLYVTGLAHNVTRDRLGELFSSCGTVESATVMINKITDLPDGYGFVEMSCESEAEEAIRELNNTQVEGQIIKVHLARPRQVAACRKSMGVKMWDSAALDWIRERLDPSAKRLFTNTLQRTLRDSLN